MTITSSVVSISYAGDGVSTSFAVPFVFFGPDEIGVWLRNAATTLSQMTRGADYTVIGGGGATGTVVATVAPAVGTSWVIRRATARTQQVDYTDYDPFPAATHEQAVDRLTAQVQENDESIGRSIRGQFGDGTVLALPPAATRASKYLTFDAFGQPSVSLPAGAGASVSSAMMPVVGAASLVSAMTLLGISPAMQTFVAAVSTNVAAGLLSFIGAMTGAISRTLKAKLGDYVTSADFAGIDPTGVVDSTAGLQAMINHLQSQGGGTGTILVGTYKILGTLYISTGNIVLQGASQYGVVLNFANGAGHGIAVGYQASSLQGVSVRNMSLVGVAKTGGWAIIASKFANSVFSDLSIRNCFGGIAVAVLNNVMIQSCEIIHGYANGLAGIHWSSPANATDRSDVLTIRDVVVNGNNFSGVNGIILDGMCQTLRVQSSGLIHVDRGLWVRNSAASNSYFPQFIYCDDMEIDGVNLSAMIVEGGRQMHFTNCDFFNSGGAGADTDGIRLLADGSASVTNYITFVSCRIDGARQRAVYCEAKMVEFTSCFINASVQGSGLYDGLVIANNGGTNGAAIGVNVTGGRIGVVFGGLPYTRWGITVAAGCARVLVSGVDFSSCVTGSIQDNTGGAGNVDWNGCDEINGTPMADRLPTISADPTSLYNGMMWHNVTTGQVKGFFGGTTKVFTLV